MKFFTYSFVFILFLNKVKNFSNTYFNNFLMTFYVCVCLSVDGCYVNSLTCNLSVSASRVKDFVHIDKSICATPHT